VKVAISSGSLEGSIGSVPSKSYAHRALICAALADETTELGLRSLNADTEATIDCLTAIGADIRRRGDILCVTPPKILPHEAVLCCGESGSTLRFLLPVAAALFENSDFSGNGTLPGRPIAELLTAMRDNGAGFSGSALPFSVKGRLRPGSYAIPGDISSQYISGLLMALPLLDGKSEIVLTSPLRAAAYVEITLDMLSKFGVGAEPTERGFTISGRQAYISPGWEEIEGDWTSASYFLAAGALGGGVTVRGLSMKSKQGDRAIVDILKAFGAAVTVLNNSVTVAPGVLRACRVDIASVPDLFPILAVLAANAEGKSVLYNASALRFKESDRIKSTAAMINSLGGYAVGDRGSLEITGKKLRGGEVDSFGDHRIVMSSAIAALACRGPVFIAGAEAVGKSYPSFFKNFTFLGGKATMT